MLRLATDQGRQTKDGREETAYWAFVANCGQHRSRRLRLLLDDVRASQALAFDGRARAGLGDRWPVGLRVVGVNRYVWPLPEGPAEFHCPAVAGVAFHRYRELYAAAHHDRHDVTSVPQLCTADVEAAHRDSRRAQFTTTIFQAAVLLQFNGRSRTACVTGLRARTGIPEPELRHTLESLLRDGVLRTSDSGRVFRLHRDYCHADADDDDDCEDDCVGKDDDGTALEMWILPVFFFLG